MDSIRALNPLPKEVLIADDGSKADMREVIQSYAQNFPCELRHIWHEDKGFRLAQIRNEAIKSARGDYIIIIDGDMIVDSRFVAEHLRFAKRGVFLQGSRVILREGETANILEAKNYALAFDSRSLKATHCDFYANLIYTFSKTTAKIFRKKELIKGVRGCNMSFYKADCEAINGFNEEFVGWGREDSEFVARFLFKGGELRRVKHNAIAYHLYHAENPRSALESNHNIYIYAKLKRLGQKWACKRAKSPESRGKSPTDSSKKRVLITLKDITEGGGGERVGVNLANAFAQNLGYEVQIVSFFCTHKTPIYPLDSRISCVYLCDKKAKSKNVLTTLFHKSILRVIFCLKTHKIARQTNADIVLANDGWFIPLFAPKKRDFKPLFVRLWHLSAPKKARRKLHYFDTLVVLSSRELPTWQRYHNNVRVIPNFIPQIPQKSTNHAQKVVLSVGRMDNGDQKGFLRLIDIWKIVQEMIKSPLPCVRVVQGVGKNPQNKADSAKDSTHSNPPPVSPSAREGEDLRDFSDLSQWKLTIVGDGILKSEIQAKIHALNLQDSIILKPFTKEIEREYLGASIYAMASHFEGFGMVLAEASSYGLPCIAFDIATGPSDIIAHNKSGYLVSDNDLEGYAKHLIKLMSDENLRMRFGAESKRRVSEKFSQSVVIQKWQNLFENKS